MQCVSDKSGAILSTWFPDEPRSIVLRWFSRNFAYSSVFGMRTRGAMQEKRDWRLGLPEEGNNLGDNHPNFRFSL